MKEFGFYSLFYWKLFLLHSSNASCLYDHLVIKTSTLSLNCTQMWPEINSTVACGSTEILYSWGLQASSPCQVTDCLLSTPVSKLLSILSFSFKTWAYELSKNMIIPQYFKFYLNMYRLVPIAPYSRSKSFCIQKHFLVQWRWGWLERPFV